MNIDFDDLDLTIPAKLMKWPSLHGQKISASTSPYTVREGTLEHCIKHFVEKPMVQLHLYEIHIEPGATLDRVLTSKQVADLVIRMGLTQD